MTNVVTTPTGSGYNATQINTNIERLKNGINAETLHRRGGNNKMEQSLDMNGFTVYNIGADTTNGSSVVTQDQFDDLVAQITAEVAANIGFVVDGDVIVGAGVTLGTAAFQDIQTNYYEPGDFDTSVKTVLVNGAFGLGSELAEVGSYTGNLNSIDPVTGLSTTQIRYIEGSATNLPREGEPGYLIQLQKDSTKSAQLFISEAGSGGNEEAWDISNVVPVDSISSGLPYSSCLLWHPEGTLLLLGNPAGRTGDIDVLSLSTPWDITTKTFIGSVSYAADVGGSSVANLTGIAWGLDGNSILLVSGQTVGDDKVFETALNTPYDVFSKGTNTAHTISPSLEKTGIWMSQDGLHLAMCRGNGISSAYVIYDLSVAGDLNSVGPVKNGSLVSYGEAHYVAISDDGTKVLVMRRENLTTMGLRLLELSDPWNPSTAVVSANASVVVGENTLAFTIDPSGTYMIGNGPSTNLYTYTLGSILDLGPGVSYRTKNVNEWSEWKRFITDKDPANIKSTFTVGGEIDVPIISGVATIDCSLGNSFNLVSTEDLTLTFVNAPEVGDDYTCKVKVTNGGSFLFILDSQIKVTGGVLPPLTASGVDIAVLTFNGTDIYGLISIPDAS